MKYLYAAAVTPNGAAVNVHRLHRVSLDKQRVLLTLNHFVDADQELPTWQDEYEMPIDAFILGAYPDCVWDWITTSEGLFPDGVVLEELGDLETTKKMAIHKIERLRDGHVAGGLTIPGLGTIQTGPRHTENIMGAINVAVIKHLRQEPFVVNFKMLDDTFATLDADGAFDVGLALAGMRGQIYEHSWALKDLVEEATTMEELQAINLEAGWPE